MVQRRKLKGGEQKRFLGEHIQGGEEGACGILMDVRGSRETGLVEGGGKGQPGNQKPRTDISCHMSRLHACLFH